MEGAEPDVKNSEVTNMTKEAATMGLPNLPTEIIDDILLRLPVKSLLKFRCVSKSWHSYISDPKFSKTHLNKSAADGNYTNHRFITSFRDRLRTVFNSYSLLHTIFNEPSLDDIELTPPYPNNGNYSCNNRLVGSCNGVICIALDGGKFISLWNPSTRESRQLPNPGLWTLGDYVFYGFGYDYLSDDYKVMTISYRIKLTYPNLRFYRKIGKIKVYTLRTNSWKDIQPNPSGLPASIPDVDGIFLGGAFIWPAVDVFMDPNEHANPIECFKIVALDLANETLQELPQPVIGNDGDGGGYNKALGVLGECLCFIAYQGNHVDLWVMKEYGVSESWTKLMKVPYTEDINWSSSSLSFPHYKPIWFFKNGEILLELNSHLVIYNSKDNKFQAIHGIKSSRTPCVYIESLVSLSPNAEHRDERQLQ